MTKSLISSADDFYLEIGEAPLTLNEWSRQANVQILFDYHLMRGVYTNPVKCSCTPLEALRTLLRHLGLIYDFVNERTVAVTQGVQTGEGPDQPIYPTVEEYRRWFDRLELEEPAQSYGYDLNINLGRLEEDHGNHTDPTSTASLGLRSSGDHDKATPSHSCRDCKALWVPVR